MKLKKKIKNNCVSLALSGGIDSGITLAKLRSVLPEIKLQCICMGFDEKDDEIVRAEEIARFYNCNFSPIIKENVLYDLPKLIKIVKEPRWNLYQYYVLEKGSKYSKQFFSGDGGDELFAGYTFRYRKYLSKISVNSTWQEKTKKYLSCHERDWVPDQEKIFGEKIRFSWGKIYQRLHLFFSNSLFPLDQVFLADFNGKLVHDWIPTNNAFAKYLGSDVHSIFLTQKMINFATHVPWYQKYNPNDFSGKIPLISVLKQEIGFKQLCPIKKGFTVNLKSIWENYGKEIIKTYLNSDSEVFKNKIIRESWVEKIIRKLSDNQLQQEVRYISKLFGILSLEIWYRLFISKTMKTSEKLD